VAIPGPFSTASSSTKEFAMSEFNQGPEVVPNAPPAVAGSGLTDNVAGALAYVTIIPAILFLVLEPYNRNPFIRFHAFQSLGLGVCAVVCSMIMIVPILGWLIGLILLPVLFVAWIICIFKAYSGKFFKLPIIGNIVESMAR
jgi:uncharacterized membrane protein